MLNPSPDTGIDSIFNLNTESTSLVVVLVTTIAETPLSFATTLPLPPIPLISHLQQTSVPTPATVPKFKQTNQFAIAVSSVPGIVDMYLTNKMNEAVKIAIQLQSDKLRDKAQAKNEDFINKLDDNIKKIIKEQVKEQVKAQVSKIFPKIKKTINEQLKAEVLTHSSNESKTSHAIAANLSKLELQKILIDKMERNKSIHRSNEQKNVYKALVDAYESDKLLLDTYRDTVMMKRRVAEDQPDEETSQLPNWFQKLAKPPTSDRDWNKTLPNAHRPAQPWLSTSAQKEDMHESFNELMDTPLDFSAFVMNRLKVDTLTPKLLADPTFELMKGSCKSLVELEYFFKEVYKATTNQLDWNNPEMTKTKAADYGHIKWIKDLVPNRMESARDVYSRHRIIAVTKLQIVKWHNYKHLDWITVRRNDDKLYKFKEGDYKRLRLQDIEDMLLLLVQGKLTNLTIEERLALNVSLRIDSTLNDVRTALDDIQNRIRMKYLP
ncbi:hypothetical protein Tco_1392426 [Tanacetum coccineum]